MENNNEEFNERFRIPTVSMNRGDDKNKEKLFEATGIDKVDNALDDLINQCWDRAVHIASNTTNFGGDDMNKNLDEIVPSNNEALGKSKAAIGSEKKKRL